MRGYVPPRHRKVDLPIWFFHAEGCLCAPVQTPFESVQLDEAAGVQDLVGELAHRDGGHFLWVLHYGLVVKDVARGQAVLRHRLVRHSLSEKQKGKGKGKGREGKGREGRRRKRRMMKMRWKRKLVRTKQQQQQQTKSQLFFFFRCPTTLLHNANIVGWEVAFACSDAAKPPVLLVFRFLEDVDLLVLLKGQVSLSLGAEGVHRNGQGVARTAIIFNAGCSGFAGLGRR